MDKVEAVSLSEKCIHFNRGYNACDLYKMYTKRGEAYTLSGFQQCVVVDEHCKALDWLIDCWIASGTESRMAGRTALQCATQLRGLLIQVVMAEITTKTLVYVFRASCLPVTQSHWFSCRYSQRSRHA